MFKGCPMTFFEVFIFGLCFIFIEPWKQSWTRFLWLPSFYYNGNRIGDTGRKAFERVTRDNLEIKLWFKQFFVQALREFFLLFYFDPLQLSSKTHTMKQQMSFLLFLLRLFISIIWKRTVLSQTTHTICEKTWIE